MKQLTTIVLWILHWALQGLKLYLFGTIAAIAAILGCLPFVLIGSGLKRFVEPGPFASIADFVASGLGLLVALAVATATFANMLNEHPLLPFVPKRPIEPRKPS